MVNNNCKIVNNIGEGSEGKNPCEICSAIVKLGEIVNQTKKEIGLLEPVKAYQRMLVEYKKLSNSHLKCVGCGLCFGGHHIAKTFRYIKELKGDVCQWCAIDIDKNGLELFIQRVKHQLDLDKENTLND
jgi:hypothetical protein